jgi:hypothetical protein
VEELEGQLLEQEGRLLEQEEMEDTRAQVLACELNTNSREASLRDQEAKLVAQER